MKKLFHNSKHTDTSLLKIGFNIVVQRFRYFQPFPRTSDNKPLTQ